MTDSLPDQEGMTAEEYMEAMREAATELQAPDIQDKLARLDELAGLRRKNPRIEAEYESLRDELAEYLHDTGPVYYLDRDHAKRYAWPVEPESLIVDIAKLIELYEAGDIDVDIDRVAPRKVNNEELKKAVAKKKIPPREFLKIARLEKGTAHVRFSDPQDTGR